jgi:molybdate transport system substrate-binding protein
MCGAFQQGLAASRQYERLRSSGMPHETALVGALGSVPGPSQMRRRTAKRSSARLVAARIAATSALALALLGGGGAAGAEEIRLLSAAAMQSVFKEIAGDFERTSGHKLTIAYGTIGGVTQRILAGETADLVIGSTLSLPSLVKEGKIDAGSQVTICRTGIGIVVPSGTPASHVGSIEDFKRAVLDARVVVYADPVRGGAAGVHVARVLQKLGVADRLKSQITLAAGGDITEVTLAQGSGALGITQVSEIVGKPGTEFLGPLPDELQNYTVFVAGTPVSAKQSEAVTAFVAFLKSQTAIAAIKAKGMQVD